MLGSRLLLLIQAHAGPLTHDTVKDLLTNERTSTFRRLNPADVETRVSALYYNLGKWIGDPDEGAVRREYEEMGRSRFREGVPVSEPVYALLITKQHLRRYIREQGLVDFAGDRVTPEELLRAPQHPGAQLPGRRVLRSRPLSPGLRLRGGGPFGLCRLIRCRVFTEPRRVAIRHVQRPAFRSPEPSVGGKAIEETATAGCLKIRLTATTRWMG